jgi:uncharacterized membrane protein YccC|tara:strand:- start:1977 stop:2483 length:507 start_codon:yes stop_codon:yes gene_type:complete
VLEAVKIGIAVAALGLAFGAGWTWQGARSDAAMSDLVAQHATALAKATEAARTEERRRFQSVAQEGAKGDEELQDIRERVVVGDAESDRLRQRLDQVTSYYRADNSRLATKWATAEQTIGVLTGLLGEYDGFASAVAGGYEDARARGLTCERAWDAIRGETGGGAPRL